jgi:hypothetical protein
MTTPASGWRTGARPANTDRLGHVRRVNDRIRKHRAAASLVVACNDRHVRSLASELVLLVALLGLTGVVAPRAHADAVDNNFLNALASRGITFSSGQAAIVAAHEVCDELDGGRASSDVANDVMQQSSLDGYHAGFFVGVSIAAFCPRHSGA